MNWILTLALVLFSAAGVAARAAASTDEIVRPTNIRRDLLHPSAKQKAKEESEAALLSIQQTAPLTSPYDRILPSPGTHADYEARVGERHSGAPSHAPHYEPHRSLQPLDKAQHQTYPGQFQPVGIDPASR